MIQKEKNLYELLYTSVEACPFTPPSLMNLLKDTRIKNDSLNITGMLLYHKGEILQILEGDRASVKQLYQTIAQDQRHKQVEVFHQGHIILRSFSEWSMAFKILDQQSIQTYLPSYNTLGNISAPIELFPDPHSCQSLTEWSTAYRALNSNNLNKYLPGYQALSTANTPTYLNRESRNPGKKAFLSLFKAILQRELQAA